MSENKGAFIEALEHIWDADRKEKARLMRDMLDNPGKYPELENMTGQQWGEFIFGDLCDFLNKMGLSDPKGEAGN